MAKVINRKAHAKASIRRLKEIARKKMFETDDPDQIRHLACIIESATELRPARFDGRNRTGPRAKTQRRIELISRLLSDADPKKRQERARMLWDIAEIKKEFESYDSLYRFLDPKKYS